MPVPIWPFSWLPKVHTLLKSKIVVNHGNYNKASFSRRRENPTHPSISRSMEKSTPVAIWDMTKFFKCQFQTLWIVPVLLSVQITHEQYCFFTIHTIFHDISIWCNISRYFYDIFQAVNWSKICLVSTKICPGSIYVEIFATKMPYLYFYNKNDLFHVFFCCKNVPYLKCQVKC